MKKRIALVMNTLSDGGTERMISNLSRGLSGKYDIDIVLNDDYHIDYPFKGRIISLELPHKLERMGMIYQVLALIKRTYILRRLKRHKKYSAVVSFSEMTSIANVLSGNRDVKTIVSVRNAIDMQKKSGQKQKLFLPVAMLFLCRNADLTVSCSKEIADDLVEHYGLPSRKSRVIYNGLELSTIREKANKSLPPAGESAFPERKTIITVGRMTLQKGQWHLLNAVKILHDKGIPAQLIILGDGKLRPILEERARKLGISDYVNMPGFMENPYQNMALADVFVMPSLYEGFSNAILEALACGVPVISTDHKTGAREILAPDSDYRQKITDRIDLCEYGILVPVCNGDLKLTFDLFSKEEDLLADALRMILTDTKLAERYRQASLERAEQLNMEAVCQQWISLLEER